MMYRKPEMEIVKVEFDELVMTSGLSGDDLSLGNNEDHTGVGNYGDDNGEW